MPDYDHEAFRYGIAGASGMGKSTRLKNLILAARARCVFAYDPTGQLASKFGQRPVTRCDQIAAAILTGWVCFRGDEFGDTAEAFNWFADTAFALTAHMEGRKFFVADEIQSWVTSRQIPEGFHAVIQKGRWHGLDLAFTCQTFNELHNNLRAQVTRAAAFAHIDATASDWLTSKGFPARELAALHKGEYLERNLIPLGPISFGDDQRGAPRPLPGQAPAESPVLAALRGKPAKRTR